MKIGIVGAQEDKWSSEQKRICETKIRQILSVSRDAILVSGHCPLGGIDIWSEQIADSLGIKKEIHPAPAKQWNDVHYFSEVEHKSLVLRGYRSRNIQIAEASDILYVISPKCLQNCPKCMPGKLGATAGHVWNGGLWAGNFAEKLGKKVVRIAI